MSAKKVGLLQTVASVANDKSDRHRRLKTSQPVGEKQKKRPQVRTHEYRGRRTRL